MAQRGLQMDGARGRTRYTPRAVSAHGLDASASVLAAPLSGLSASEWLWQQPFLAGASLHLGGGGAAHTAARRGRPPAGAPSLMEGAPSAFPASTAINLMLTKTCVPVKKHPSCVSSARADARTLLPISRILGRQLQHSHALCGSPVRQKVVQSAICTSRLALPTLAQRYLRSILG